jgi:putative CocE/NonD family hydrolase
MRDGVALLADHYAPTTSKPAGTILVRGIYGRGGLAAIIEARVYALRGYHVVLQSARGTFGSGGEFTPGAHEADDGADTVVWLREQPWFTGRFATLGGSYLGYTQWAMLMDPPPELATAIISVGPHDLSTSAWGTGAFTLLDFLGWSDLVARQEEGGVKPWIVGFLGHWRVNPVMRALPLGEAGRGLLREGAPWYEAWVGHPDLTAEYWQPVRMTPALDRVEVPVLLMTGWQDLFLQETLYQFEHLRARGVHPAMTIGPWNHGQIALNGAGQTTRESLDWLAEHLGDAEVRRRPSPVRIFITGRGEWRELPDWPPSTDEKALYLQPGLTLGDRPPPLEAHPSRFVYDPADPTPTIGGRTLSATSGYRRDDRLAVRDDVLAFTGPPLAEDLEVVGIPYVELTHSSDIPYADVAVRLSEVDAKDRSHNISDGFVRLGPTRTSPLRIDLDAMAHRFRAGHRIRLLIAGGSHPRYARNLGTDDPPLTAQRLVRSTHTVAHGSGGVSRLVLPVTGTVSAP